MRLGRVASPVGTLLVVASQTGIRAIAFDPDWLTRRFRDETMVEEADPLDAVTRLRAWFDGDLRALDALPIEPEGTPFQQRVWEQLRRIPCGSTTTYGRIATELGNPRATRAVGLANGSNPIPVIIPCHRVIGADRTLTGYGGGLERKRWLLKHEGVDLPFR